MRFKKSNILFIISGVLIFVGLVLLLESYEEVPPLNLEPLSYSQMRSYNISPGQRVRGDIIGNYGSYMEQYSTIYGVRAGTDYDYYLIDLGNEGYIGVEVLHGPTSEKFDKQSEETYAYWSGETSIPPTPISFDGVIQKASNQEQQIMKEALIQMGYTSSEAIKYVSPYMIKAETSLSSSTRTIGWIIAPGGFFLLIVAIIIKIIQKNNRIVAEQPVKKNIYTPYDPSIDSSNPFGDSMNGAQYSGGVSGLSSYDDMNDYEDEYEEDDDDDDDDDQPKSKFSLKLDD